ncbi:MAG: hypothetical protein ACK4FN_09685, partial [Acinetobacter johnsonii]
STQVVLHNLLMIFLLTRHQQARSAILLSFKKKSTGFVNYFKPIQDFQILPLGLNPCFSTSFNQHHRRWMCILQHFTSLATPFSIILFQANIFWSKM